MKKKCFEKNFFDNCLRSKSTRVLVIMDRIVLITTIQTKDGVIFKNGVKYDWFSYIAGGDALIGRFSH